MILLKLYMVFFKIGLFAIGGGLATLPFLQEIVDKYGWITSRELLNMIAISESTPGPIGINTATFVGNSKAGVVGGLVATLGIITPSIIIIIIISHYFSKFSEEEMVQSAFIGIRPAVSGLMAAVALNVSKITLLKFDLYKKTGLFMDLFDFKSLILFILIFALMSKTKKHPIFYILLSGLIGVIFKF